MRAFRPILRRQTLNPIRHIARPQPTIHEPFRRHQHTVNNYGPHKEYFQTPGQVPLPDTTPYDPSQPIQTLPTEENGRSRGASFVRGSGWAILFCLIGTATGVAFVTWEYLQPPYEPGSPEEVELLEEIEQLLDTHPLVLGLRDQGWIEEDFYTRRALSDRDKGNNMVHETLRGSSQTLTIKAFKDQSKQTTFLVFFVGFGLDGFPDVMHGGVTASLLLEARDKHLANFAPDYILNKSESSMKIDYKHPVRPGEIYAIMVPPETLEPDPKDHSKQIVRLSAILMRLETAPQISSQWNSRDNTLVHKVEVPAPSGQLPFVAAAFMSVPYINRSKPLGFAKAPSFALAGREADESDSKP